MYKLIVPPPYTLHLNLSYQGLPFSKTLLAVAVASVFIFNAQTAHSEVVVSEKLSSSQIFSDDVRFTTDGGINAPSLSAPSDSVIINASGHKMTFDGSQIRVGNNQTVQIKADEIVFTGVLPGSEQSGAITVQTGTNRPATLEFSNKVKFENAQGVVLSTQGQGDSKIIFNQGLEIDNMTFGSATMLAKLQQVELYTTDLSFTKISSANRSNGTGSAFEIWGGGYLNVSQNDGVGTGTLSIDDFQGTHGLYIYGGIVDVQNLAINNMYVADSSTSSVQGVYALGNLYISGRGEIQNIVGNNVTEGLQGTLISDINYLSIHDVTSKTDTARGIRLYEQSRNSSFAQFGDLRISNITGATKAEGFNMSAGTDLESDDALLVRNLDISSINAVNEEGMATGLVVSTSSLRISESAKISTDVISGTYNGAFAQDPAVHSVREAAVRVMHGGQILMDGADGVYSIEGTIVVGKGDADSTDKAGNLVISGAQTVIRGDVYAGNGGQINLTLTGEGSLIEGQIDDYHELATPGLAADTVFHNANFYDNDGNEEVVKEAGSVNLTLNGSKWIARGQSFVDTVTFGENGGTIDLTKNDNSSVSIENLSGSGTFNMKLGAYTEGGTDAVQSDMLYIQNVGADSSFTINATLADGVNVSDLEGLRFATVGNVEGGHSTDLFKFVEIKDQGFNNWKLSVAKEDYSTDDADNSRFNGEGDGEGSYKPGENVVDAIYGESNTETAALADEEKSQNYFIDTVEKNEGGGEDNPSGGSTISDAGQAIIATARALYYNAIEIDRFNQRYGDRRYDENNKSLWARVRQDRWGTAAGIGDFKSQNTTYQIGFDYTRPSESGKMIFGAAVDLMDGNTDYESIDGSGETKRYAVSAYATYLGDNGGYVDVVGKVGRLSNEYAVKLDSGAGVSADYMNWMAGLSVEVGHQLSTDDSRRFFEPQVQAQYVFVFDNDYSNGQTEIEQDSIHSFITRAGFRAGRWLGEEKNANVYFKTDVMHEWAGDQGIHVSDKTTAAGGESFNMDNKGTWFDVGLGFQAPVGKSFYAYGDAEYRFGNDLDQTWVFNFGGKYVF